VVFVEKQRKSCRVTGEESQPLALAIHFISHQSVGLEIYRWGETKRRPCSSLPRTNLKLGLKTCDQCNGWRDEISALQWKYCVLGDRWVNKSLL